MLGVSHNTINRGIRELKASVATSTTTQRIRKQGGGRKKKITDHVWHKIEGFISPHTRGEPESALQWVSKSLRNIESALGQSGTKVSHRVIGDALKERGFSLQANRKTYEGKGHKDSNAQFENISRKVEAYQSENQPVISVDAKKRELIGNYKNQGAAWCARDSASKVNAYDFPSDATGVAIPYGIYDLSENKGWVNVGINKDTAAFAVQSIRNWWYKMGIYSHNQANSLLITCDGGGSNSSKGRLWKYELQQLANETGMSIEVAHFPPGTSKWNKIEHRLFSYISKNWRGRPLLSYQVIVNLIGSTKTGNGLTVACEMDNGIYETGIRISDGKMQKMNIAESTFYGDWNYTINPQ